MERLNLAQTHSIIAQVTGISIRKRDHDTMPAAVKTLREDFGRLFRKLGLNKGVEVGVNTGTYSQMLCEKHPDIELFCIDTWQRYPGRYRRARRKLRPYNATLIQSDSMEALNRFEDDSLDFAYIDANHTFDYVMADIIFWSRKVRQFGIIACHDYFAIQDGGVVQAVDAYTFCHNIRPWYVTREVFPSVFWVKP